MALIAPLVAHHGLVQRLAQRAADKAEAVERLHQRLRLAHGHAAFKAAQRALAEGLLVEEVGDALAVDFLIVAGQVLGAGVDALGLHALHDGAGAEVVHVGILGEVLEGAAAKGVRCRLAPGPQTSTTPR